MGLKIKILEEKAFSPLFMTECLKKDSLPLSFEEKGLLIDSGIIKTEEPISELYKRGGKRTVFFCPSSSEEYDITGKHLEKRGSEIIVFGIINGMRKEIQSFPCPSFEKPTFYGVTHDFQATLERRRASFRPI